MFFAKPLPLGRQALQALAASSALTPYSEDRGHRGGRAVSSAQRRAVLLEDRHDPC